MKKKQLMIGIPTIDHPDYIRFYLAKVLPHAKQYNIDIYIHDSSSGTETKQIVEERVQEGYNNLFYVSYDHDVLYEEKLKNIMVNSGYEYVWLCGDGIVPNLERSVHIIKENIDQKIDFILFDPKYKNQQRKKLYTEAKSILKDYFAPLTLAGATIIRGDLFTEEDWDYYTARYLEQCHQACFFEKFRGKQIKAVYYLHNFYEGNPYKTASVAAKKGRIIEAFAGLMTRTVELLPEEYNEVKLYAQKAVDEYTKVFSVGHLWTLRMNGNLNWKIALKYRKSFKKATNTKFFNIFIISLCPVNIATGVAMAYGELW